MTMTPVEVVNLMESACSDEDWNNKCDQVKKACNGYPKFWFELVILSGLASRVAESFETRREAG